MSNNWKWVELFEDEKIEAIMKRQNFHLDNLK